MSDHPAHTHPVHVWDTSVRVFKGGCSPAGPFRVQQCPDCDCEGHRVIVDAEGHTLVHGVNLIESAFVVGVLTGVRHTVECVRDPEFVIDVDIPSAVASIVTDRPIHRAGPDGHCLPDGNDSGRWKLVDKRPPPSSFTPEPNREARRRAFRDQRKR